MTRLVPTILFLLVWGSIVALTLAQCTRPASGATDLPPIGLNAAQPTGPNVSELTKWIEWARIQIEELEEARLKDAITIALLQDKLEAALLAQEPPVVEVDLDPLLSAVETNRQLIGLIDLEFAHSKLAEEFARHQVKLRDLITSRWQKVEHNTATGEEKVVGEFTWRLLSNWPAPDIPPDPDPDPNPNPDPEPDPDPLPDPVPGLIAPFTIRGTEFTAINGPLPTGNSLTSFGVGGWVEYQFETGVDATWQVELTSLVPGAGGMLTVSIDGIQTNLDLPFSGKAWGIVTFPSGEWALEYGEHVLRIAGTRASPSSQWGWIMDLAEVAVRVYQ